MQAKTRVKVLAAFSFLGEVYQPGVAEVSAEAVERLVRKGLAEVEAEDSLQDVLGSLGAGVVEELVKSGFDTVEKVRAASDVELDAVPGIGAARIRQVRRKLGIDI